MAGLGWTTKAAPDDLASTIRCIDENANKKPDIMERLDFLLGRCIDDYDCDFNAAFNSAAFYESTGVFGDWCKSTVLFMLSFVSRFCTTLSHAFVPVAVFDRTRSKIASSSAKCSSFVTHIHTPQAVTLHHTMVKTFITRLATFATWLSCFQSEAFVVLSTVQWHHSSSLTISSCHHATWRKLKDDDNEDTLDDFLDKPFFDPETYDEEDSGPLAWFANLVKNDYALAETLFAGCFFIILLIITQELLRMQLYGDGYIPFTRLGASGGNLF